MKHPDPKLESYEFNLSKAPELRCVQGLGHTICGECESCSLREKLVETRAWFQRAGDQTQRRFALGVVRRLNSPDLLSYVIRLLQPLLCKDFTYARARTTPSLASDTATMASNRALDSQDTEAVISETWFWFQSANYWTKSNFLLGFLQLCSYVLLFQIGQQAQTLLMPEKKAFVEQDDYESASIASTTYSFQSEEHPELALLSSARPQYSAITQDPFGPPTEPSEHSSKFGNTQDSFFNMDEIINDDEDSDVEFSELSSVDPTCMVIPASTKAYSGVARHKDFIRSLPVHLSKLILGFLDTSSLHNCVCVSRHWRILVEEVHREYYVNQHLWEEVMLMQGSEAQGCNQKYAKDIDVAVPNLIPNSFEAIRTDNVQSPPSKFKVDSSFKTAYMGYSTRNIIMEERNVYCGPYNVMVLIDNVDPARVIHTDGSRLVATGSTDRKVRFVDTETANPASPVITGHAGSVRCVYLHHKQGFVLSGSYDTSIRQWSLQTGKCMKIFRGHRDTVQCMVLLAGRKWLASGAKDKMVKVWDIESAKCFRTFKHRHPITAVALSEDLCISGCEAGKVKVWCMKTGDIVKRLNGHHGSVSAIRFDKWHIVTAGRDGYALAWSAQGDHSRCLTALRHPKEVLCLEYMYLRAITGSEDGKLRIWNIVTGQCLRIMRGNSRSDPINDLVAIGNRLTINTSNNTLVLNFEQIEFDYTLETDKMPSMVQYSKYSEAPIRPQPYSYVRAQRMKKAGATNKKLVRHAEEDDGYVRHNARPVQTAHSAKTLSTKTMQEARKIQSAGARMQRAMSSAARNLRTPGASTSKSRTDPSGEKVPSSDGKSAVGAKSSKSVSIYGGKDRSPAVAPSMVTKSKAAMSTRSGTSVVGFQLGAQDDDSDISSEDYGDMKRRVSWAFEHPAIPKTKELTLSETKALLRSQIRAKEEVVPPDFIYLTVNAIQNSLKQTDAYRNMEIGRVDPPAPPPRQPGRPSSSPSRIDPRTRVPVEELDLDQLMIESDMAPRDLDVRSSSAVSVVSSHRSSRKAAQTVPFIPKHATIITEYAPMALDASPQQSLHSRRVKSSIPKPRLLRPHTAALLQKPDPLTGRTDPRPASASASQTGSGRVSRAGAFPVSLAINAAMGPVQVPGNIATHNKVKSSAAESSFVPMLMYPSDLGEKREMLRQRRIARQNSDLIPVGQKEGRVSKYNGPMRDHVDFKLHTHNQVEEDLEKIAKNFEAARKQKLVEQDKKQRDAWLAKVKGKTQKDFSKRRKSLAPELGEYGSIETVA